MEKTTNDYQISFFKPTTDRARFNRDLVIWLASIWFIAIFGFHIVLRVIEKPTPEPVYTEFTGTWDDISSGTASETQIATFGSAALSVIGKVAIAPDEKAILDQAMSWAIYQLTAEESKHLLLADISQFRETRNNIELITNPVYVKQKQALSENLAPVLNLSPLDVRSKLLPLGLTTDNIKQLSAETQAALPGIMEKYLVHNQSVLTDFKFLGFPFHYFYSAVFLLILFVALCWLYCVRTDRRNVLLNIEE